MRPAVSGRPGGAHLAHGEGNRLPLHGSRPNPAPILRAAPFPLGTVLRCAAPTRASREPDRYCQAGCRGLRMSKLATLAPGNYRVRPPYGLRRGGILTLRWSQVDLTGRTLTILEQKNGSRDTLPANDTAMAVLQAHAAVRTSSTEAVFLNGADHPRNAHNLLWTFYPAMRKAGITRFRFHDLRHTFATRFIQAGVDVYSVQKLGRWKTISMVLRYAHHQPESLRGEVPRCWIDCGEKAHNAGTIGRGSK
jgi:integrase